MDKNKGLAILNTLTLAQMLLANYGSNAGIFSNLTVADVSHKYDTLFAPAGYAFIIWGLIFLLCTAFVIYQWVLLKNGDPKKYIQRTGIWFALSNIANAAWVYCWTNQLIGWSVILIIFLLICLCVLTFRLRLELDDEPVLTIFLVWWPIVFYLGWMMVATVACVASWLVYTGWRGGFLGEDSWTIIMIVVAGILFLLLLRKRNMREAAMVGAWALIAIAVRQWQSYTGIAISAILVSVILLAAAAFHGIKNSYYGPAEKIKRGEWK